MQNFTSALAGAFKSDILAQSAIADIENQAQHGRIAFIVLSATVAQYGLTLPAKPADFIRLLNSDFLTGTVPAKSVKLVQALHLVAATIAASGVIKSLPTLLPLPDSANPEVIEAKNKAKAEKAKATKAAKQKASGPSVTLPMVNTSPQGVTLADVLAFIQSADMEDVKIIQQVARDELEQLQKATDKELDRLERKAIRDRKMENAFM